MMYLMDKFYLYYINLIKPITMKNLATSIFALLVIFSMNSCKESKETDELNDATATQEHDDAGHEMHSMDHEQHDTYESTTLMVGKELTVPMGSKSGSNVSGTISFKQTENNVTMNVALKGLTPGTHAIHIHQNGDCSADDGSSAGGHWDPTMENHGKWGEGMHHSGDIGNLEVAADGLASLDFNTDKWCLGCDDQKRNIIGKGLIVHASADDFKSQPSGAAGARVACGVIE